MKYDYSTLLLLSSLVVACSQQPQPSTSELDGRWVGPYTEKQTSKVPAGTMPVSLTATFQTTNESLVATVQYTVGQRTSPEPVQYAGAIKDHRVRMEIPRDASCDPTLRTYTLRMEGLVQGDSLVLVGQDTICPVQGWIYERRMLLRRQ